MRPGAFGADRNAQLGAQNLAQRCLAISRGERVAFLTHGDDPSFAVVHTALEEAGGVIEALDLRSLDATKAETAIRAVCARCTASIVLGAPLPIELHHTILRVIESSTLRHVHIVTADMRVLASSCRADPFVIEKVNAAIVDELERSNKLRCESAAGTALDVRLGSFPILSGSGRAKPGYWDNVPSGVVYFHPLVVSGVFVADRGVQISGHQLDDKLAHRNPLTVTVASGRVVKHHCKDSELAAKFDDYLSKHPDAGRVGMVALPTNYLARIEIGHRAHDGLLPGLRLHLGWSNARFTKAPFDTQLSCRLVGRKQHITCGDQQWLRDGRFVGKLAELTSLHSVES
ncbi:MAG: hypothetical protein U0269_37080 [Polyangiales bacterium]